MVVVERQGMVEDRRLKAVRRACPLRQVAMIGLNEYLPAWRRTSHPLRLLLMGIVKLWPVRQVRCGSWHSGKGHNLLPQVALGAEREVVLLWASLTTVLNPLMHFVAATRARREVR